ncbi:hypothetical protein OKW21_001910 [Catalinimonas alkaloidigena]|uniref:hypothetical protein n=1 Tax=Catalinimonas alkaloidigena TaxID=1075417 RepID=UPI0024073253|nr:hypothetical protein [Catalinimonas alkaloidigena]MDF9796647.1 hypothetical protein [Catalinimonas alkaloidigena]
MIKVFGQQLINNIYPPVLLLVLLFFFGACASTHREKMLEESLEIDENSLVYKDLEARFTSSQLSEEELMALEVRAAQKFQDFIDYLNLLARPDLDTVFRQQAVRQLQSLFVDSLVSISLQGEEKQMLRDMLPALEEASTEHGQYSIQHIEVAVPLRKTGAAQYAGSLKFEQLESNKNVISKSGEAFFLVKKVSKQFGQQKEWVWEVLLSGID